MNNLKAISDQNYLKNQQYRSGDNLDARIQLHRRFSTNPTIYFEWMFDQLNLQAGMQVLEVGCGTGEFWRTNLPRLPDNLRPKLLDLSAGMAAVARASVRQDTRFSFTTADAQNLPFGDRRFDVVLANYMLYHVPNIPQAVRELRRVLVPGGRLCAATNGTSHMQELRELMHRFHLQHAEVPDFVGRYGLKNAPSILRSSFEHVNVIPFNNTLFVTETQPLIDYIHSMVGLWNFPPDAELDLVKWVEFEIQTKGGFTIHISSGVVLAW
ncbi:MAG TPA: hypothetical protein DCP32_01910 [Anaerolineaceae bacterium]|nr:MAG: hypothetical protein A2X24_10480 [Chloroflexi bacterium GWB2_54_36]HAL15535.1 hypothetical protein [Anaerolineaceae bacterium]